MGRLTCLSVVVEDHVICITLGLPRLGNWLHQALLGYVHEIAIDRRVGVHAEEFCIVFNLLLLWMIVLLLIHHSDHFVALIAIFFDFILLFITIVDFLLVLVVLNALFFLSIL